MSGEETCSTSKNVGRVTFSEIGVTVIGFKETPMIAGYQRNVSEGNSCVAVASVRHTLELGPSLSGHSIRLTGSLIFFYIPSSPPFFSLSLHDHATLTTFFFSSPSHPVST